MDKNFMVTDFIPNYFHGDGRLHGDGVGKINRKLGSDNGTKGLNSIGELMRYNVVNLLKTLKGTKRNISSAQGLIVGTERDKAFSKYCKYIQTYLYHRRETFKLTSEPLLNEFKEIIDKYAKSGKAPKFDTEEFDNVEDTLKNVLFATIREYKLKTPQVDFADEIGRNEYEKETLRKLLKDKNTDLNNNQFYKNLEAELKREADKADMEAEASKRSTGSDLRSNLNREENKKIFTNQITDKNAIQHLADLKVPNLSDVPYQGHRSVKSLVAQWKQAEVKPEGQIKIVAADGNGIGKIGKPIICIGKSFYAVPRNDLFTKARGGIAVSDSPYKGYTKNCLKDPEFDEFRAKLAGKASVVTEAYSAETESFLNSMAKLRAAGFSGNLSKGKWRIDYKGKEYLIDKDFNEIPADLYKYAKDLKIVFGGKSNGRLRKDNYFTQEFSDSRAKLPHQADSNDIRAYKAQRRQELEESFVSKLIKDLKRSI